MLPLRESTVFNITLHAESMYHRMPVRMPKLNREFVLRRRLSNIRVSHSILV
jgi:hypothetical protein